MGEGSLSSRYMITDTVLPLAQHKTTLKHDLVNQLIKLLCVENSPVPTVGKILEHCDHCAMSDF